MDTQEVGFVKSIRDFLVHLDGLPAIRINDMVENENGVRGCVSNLHTDQVEVLLLDEGAVQPGQMFKRSGQKLSVPVGDFLLGRAINPLGIPIDGKGPLTKTAIKTADMDKPAPGIGFREFITDQLDTGVTLVDTLIPIGKGQRELVLGDARSGKTDFLLDVIVNQKYTGLTCIYAAIGKPINEVRGFMDLLSANKALAHTIVVAASSTDLAPLIFLTPQTAFTIAEYFQGQGKDVLIILDDMGNHAKIYREIALLGNRSPGRESYPGDIFYQHSHLLERAGKFNKQGGGGSITALPVIELNLNDFTTFIPTNLMSMTDGHLLFRSSLYNQGQRPAVDITLSVSRVGQQTQKRVQNSLATHIKQVLAQAEQLETVSRFSFDLPAATKLILNQRDIINEFIKQPSLTYIPQAAQTILMALPFTKPFQGLDKEFIRESQATLLQALCNDPLVVKTATKAFNQLPDEHQMLAILEMEKIPERLIALLTPPTPTQQPPRKEENAHPTSN